MKITTDEIMKIIVDKKFQKKCIITLFLISSFLTVFNICDFFRSKYSYNFKINFAKSTVPGQMQVFFANDSFTAENSVSLNDGDKKFNVEAPFKIQLFRVDIDAPKHLYYDLKQIRINNVSYSGEKLFKMILSSSLIRAELIGNICRLHIIPPGNYQKGQPLPYCDYHIVFKSDKVDSKMDFYGTSFVVQLIVFIIILLATWFPLRSISTFCKRKFSEKNKIKTFCIKSAFYVIFLLILSSAFNSHDYNVAIKLSPVSNTSRAQLYYAHANKFNSIDSVTFTKHMLDKVENDITTQFSAKQSIGALRFDIDEATAPSFELKGIKINRIFFSGKELFHMIKSSYNMKAAPDGDSCILTLLPDANGKFFPDNNVTFEISSLLKNIDYVSNGYLVKIFILICGTVLIFFIPTSKIPRAIPVLSLVSLLGFTAAFLCLRPFIFWNRLSGAVFFMLQSDLSVLLVILLCFALRFIFRSKILAVVLFAIIAFIITCVFSDCFIYDQFAVRTCIVESASWTKNLKSAIPIIGRFFSTSFAFIEILIIIFAAILFFSKSFMNKKQNNRVLFCCIGLFVAGVIIKLIPAGNNIFEQECRNVFAYSLGQKMSTPYSEKYLQSIKPFKLEYKQEKGLNLKRNTILLVVESLSSYQSKLFSGLPIDNMPQFDNEIAGATDISKKYLASSYNTTTNTFSLLTGFSPIHLPGNSLWGFGSSKYYQHPLPEIFHQNGYETVFLKPAQQVDFVDILVKKTKFDVVFDDTDPFYHDAARYVFHSVADSVMLDRLVNYVQNAKKDKKYFVYAQTVSMHAPYYDPRTNKYSYEETVRTFDMVFPKFMKNLRETGFFDNGGVLFIIGDHRAMVTIGPKEQEVMGFFTPQYVPLAIFGDIPVKLDATRHYNHVDLNYSLQYLMLDKTFRHQYQRNIFKADQPDDFYCAFFQQRTDPSLVLFQTRDKMGKIYLDGDKTKADSKNLTAKEWEEINSFLVWSRTR